MAKSKSVYICSLCGFESSKWNGRCPDCGEWNTLEETEVVSAKTASRSSKSSVSLGDKVVNIADVSSKGDEIRYETGLSELDRVLGGGIVKGSIVLIGGAPGIGKSTLLLQICNYLGENHTILYVSGEESARQIKLRANRLGVDSENLYLLAANDAEAVCRTICAEKPEIVIIDSVQTMCIDSVSSAAGSITQVRECANLFMRTAKSEEVPMLVVGHVNKDGAIAGPKVMEHIVDAVLYFEGDKNLSYRMLRGIKNRFGSTNEIGMFEMADSGLKQVENPSMTLLEGRPTGVSGCCVSCVTEGTRPIMAEVQALVCKSSFAAPRRLSTGFDFGRLTIIIAVLEKRLGFEFGNLDVYLNIVGGFRLDEPAADLAAAIALFSAFTDKVISDKLIAFGEVGLGGEIRSVSQVTKRIGEAQRMGFEACIVPKSSLISADRQTLAKLKTKINIIAVSTLQETISAAQKFKS